jgi:hypothetical protein
VASEDSPTAVPAEALVFVWDSKEWLLSCTVVDDELGGEAFVLKPIFPTVFNPPLPLVLLRARMPTAVDEQIDGIKTEVDRCHLRPDMAAVSVGAKGSMDVTVAIVLFS